MKVKVSKLVGLVVVGMFILSSSLVFGATFLSGVTTPTGLAIHPSERALYVKSGSSGTVWKVPITAAGKAGAVSVVTDQFDPPTQIAFDASGNLYGVANVGDTAHLNRLSSTGSVCSSYFSQYYNSSAIAIEAPGLLSNRIFFAYNSSYHTLSYSTLASIPCNTSMDNNYIGYSCGDFRFLQYRQDRADLVGTYDDKVVSVNIGNASCTTLISSMVQPNGIAEDSQGNLYIADTGAGTIIKRDILGAVSEVASGLSSPTGLVFDATTGLLFVSETSANRVTTLPVGIALSGKINLKIKNAAGTWGTTVKAPNQISATPPAAVLDGAGNLYVFVTKLDDTIYMSRRAPAGTWSAWTKVPGTLTTESSPTAVFKGGKILLYVRGLADDKVWESAYTISTKLWSAWKVVPGLITPGSPEATIDASGNVYLLIQGMQ